MVTDVIYNKAQIIERCLRRVDEEYAGDPDNLRNYTKQDSIILNIQRACEAAIDLAMHLVGEQGWGLPQNSRDAFVLLRKNGVLDEHLAARMQAMVGFRNIAVHEYESIDLTIVQSIIEHNLDDLRVFAQTVLTAGWARG